MPYLISLMPGVGFTCSVILFLISLNQFLIYKKTFYKRSLSISLFCFFAAFFALEQFIAQSRVFSESFTHVYVMISTTCFCLSLAFYITSLSFFIAIPDFIFKCYKYGSLVLAGLASLALPLYFFFDFSIYFDTSNLHDSSNYFMNSYTQRIGTPLLWGVSILGLSGLLSVISSILILRIVLKSSQDRFFIAGLCLTIIASTVENFFLPFTLGFFVPLIFISNLFEAFRMNSLSSQELLTEERKTIEEVEVLENEKYQNSNLTSERLEKLAAKIRHALEKDKIYLNPNLNSEGLAKSIGIPTYQLSQVVNIGLNTTFFDLLNSYRIEEAKRKLKDTNFSEKTIITIAYDSGFNSKSTFNTAFKKQTGITPSAFRKQT